MIPLFAMSKESVEEELRALRGESGAKARERRGYLLSVLGWMSRNSRDTFTPDDAKQNRLARVRGSVRA